MTNKEFNKEVADIFKTYNVVDNKIDTPFGLMYIRCEKESYHKLFSLFMRFEDDFDIEAFYRYFSHHEVINRFSKKWNLHSRDGEHILNELDERLSNLRYILQRDGKVKTESRKYVLEECDKL